MISCFDETLQITKGFSRTAIDMSRMKQQVKEEHVVRG